MNAIKVTRTIHSQTLRIKELEHFQGKTVEIIILSQDDSKQRAASELSCAPKRSAAGMLSQYRNPALIEQERTAWELAVKEKYGTG